MVNTRLNSAVPPGHEKNDPYPYHLLRRNEVTHYLQQINGTSGQRQVFLDEMVYFFYLDIFIWR